MIQLNSLERLSSCLSMSVSHQNPAHELSFLAGRSEFFAVAELLVNIFPSAYEGC